jgi:2-polyprenyl-3-methyl-5-hydroxy-6-metoxy-1,4-benzoquinol methylase
MLDSVPAGNLTVDYYNRNAEAFRDRTADCSVGHLHDAFLARLPAGAHILDAGCGPGRDAAVFLRRGFRVTSIDASSSMVEFASRAMGQPAILMPFEQIEFEDMFEGVWACASLLHVPLAQIDGVIARLVRALKPGGMFYMSTKAGDGERIMGDGRLFCDYTQPALRALLAQNPSLELLDIHQEPPFPHQTDGRNWLHATSRKRAR